MLAVRSTIAMSPAGRLGRRKRWSGGRERFHESSGTPYDVAERHRCIARSGADAIAVAVAARGRARPTTDAGA